jgi:hemoglobin/transferrin/lactoferrin receptor protein
MALDRVVVTAGTEKVQSGTPQAVTVLDDEDFALEQATTVGEALARIPGVSVTGSERVLGEGFNIRGFGSDLGGGENRLILQVDGVTKYYQQYRMGSLFTEPDLYKRVEVLRGPASSTLFGSGAIAGAISFETRDASDFLDCDDRFALRQKLEGSTNGLGFLTSTIVAGAPTPGLELLGAFIYRDNDDVRDGNGDDVVGSAFQAPSGLAKARWRFGDDRAHDLSASLQRWTTDEDGAQYEQTSTQPVFGEVDRTVTDTTATLSYGFAPAGSDLIDLKVVGGYSETQVEQRNATAAIPSVLFDDADYGYETFQVDARNTARLALGGVETFLTLGAAWSRQERTAEAESGFISFQPGGTDEKLAAYAQAEMYAGPLQIIPGVRVERSALDADGLNTTFAGESVENTAVSPKLAALWQVTDQWGVFGSIAYTERLPTLDEVFDGVSGDLTLEPETALTYEAGLSYRARDVALSDDALVAKLTLFQNDVENLIDRATQNDPFRNVGEARIRGIELEGAYDAGFAFARAGYALIRGDDLSAGEPLDSVPADELSLTLGGRLRDVGVEFGWRGVFAARQDDLPAGDDATPGYAVHDVFVSWRPDDGHLAGTEFRLGVDNIFDKAYQPHLSSDPARGRAVTLTLARTF